MNEYKTCSVCLLGRNCLDHPEPVQPDIEAVNAMVADCEEYGLPMAAEMLLAQQATIAERGTTIRRLENGQELTNYRLGFATQVEENERLEAENEQLQRLYRPNPYIWVGHHDTGGDMCFWCYQPKGDDYLPDDYLKHKVNCAWAALGKAEDSLPVVETPGPEG